MFSMSKYKKVTYIVIVAILLIVIIIAGYSVYLREKVTIYNASMDDIQRQLMINLEPIDKYFEGVELDPQTAISLRKKFEEAYNHTNTAVKEMEKLNPPDEYKKSYKKTVNRISSARDVYGELNNFSDYLYKRDKNIKEIIKILNDFQEKIGKTTSNEEVANLSTKISKKLKKQAAELKKIKTDQKIIKNNLLIKYIKELDNSLQNLSNAINDKNYDKYEQAVDGLEQSYENDWLQAFFEYDTDVLNKLEEDINKLSN